jgi:hypothetical protein
MPDGLTVISVIAGFALIAVAGARLGAGSTASLAGLFPVQGVRDWPTGVQEADAPHFNLDGAPSPPVGLPDPRRGSPETPAFEIEDLYTGPIR